MPAIYTGSANLVRIFDLRGKTIGAGFSPNSMAPPQCGTAAGVCIVRSEARRSMRVLPLAR
jgi:hypothetical protein